MTQLFNSINDMWPKGTTIWVLLFLLCIHSLHADNGFVEKGTGSIGKCIAGNCDDGEGTLEFKPLEARFVGNFSKGLPHGPGKLSIQGYHRAFDGIWHSGVFVGKCLNGTCKAGYGIVALMMTRIEITPSREFFLPTILRGDHYYIGTFQDYLPNGYGTVSYMTGATTGTFRDGRVHGYAVFASESSGEYHGWYENGNFHGQGTFICAKVGYRVYRNCKSLRGRFVKSSFTSGEISYEDGKVFKGEVSDSYLMNGSIICQNGTKRRVSNDYQKVNALNCTKP